MEASVCQQSIENCSMRQIRQIKPSLQNHPAYRRVKVKLKADKTVDITALLDICAEEPILQTTTRSHAKKAEENQSN